MDRIPSSSRHFDILSNIPSGNEKIIESLNLSKKDSMIVHIVN